MLVLMTDKMITDSQTSCTDNYFGNYLTIYIDHFKGQHFNYHSLLWRLYFFIAAQIAQVAQPFLFK